MGFTRRLRFLTVLCLWLGLAIGFLVQSASAADQLNGAGATFPYPLYSKWFNEYNKQNPQVRINYQSIGSGGGIRQLLDRTVDFGASDAPMSQEEIGKAQVPVLHIPTVLGAVVVSYNLPGINQEIRLSPEVLAGIFLGQITRWADERIMALNPKIQLPKDQAILVTYRADGSGTTSVFTDYLAKVSVEFAQKVGAGKSVRWPVGLGAKGNEGVSGFIKQTPGAIGYTELVYAETNNLPVAHLQNKKGDFVRPSVSTVAAAAAGQLQEIPADYRISITNPAGKDAYPIAAFTYLLVYQKMSGGKGKELVKFLNWAMKDGQKLAEPMQYAPLPGGLRERVVKTISTIEVQ